MFQDVVVSAGRTYIASLVPGKVLTLQGILSYQACDATTCYLPQKPVVSWQVDVESLDGDRSPNAIRHK